MKQETRTRPDSIHADPKPGLRVMAPARLHFGLLNESGELGRIDGGLGVAIREPFWGYRVSESESCRVSGSIEPELADHALLVLDRLVEKFNVPRLHVEVDVGIDPHIGLGSKTSLLMSMGRVVQAIAGTALDTRALATEVQRGGTSGVGVHLSELGGLVVDVGRPYPEAKSSFLPSSSSSAEPPALLMHRPVDQLSIVHLRFGECGPSGIAERGVFERYCPVPRTETLELLAIAISQILPGFIEGDESALQMGLGRMQNLGLKRGEWAVQDDVTTAFREHAAREVPDIALCLSSMGPTMFCVTSRPERVLDSVRSFGRSPRHLAVTEVSNSGAYVAQGGA